MRLRGVLGGLGYIGEIQTGNAMLADAYRMFWRRAARAWMRRRSCGEDWAAQ
jgi:hypothetical protein